MKRVRIGKPGRIPRLNDSSLRRLRVQLGKPPSQFGLTGECWSGALLGAFLLREYGVELSPRQCRRLLSKFCVQRSTPVHRARSSSALIASTSMEAPQSAAFVSDSERKLAALRKLKRLCSSGLPLESLVQTLFALIEDAIPNASNTVFLADPGDHPSRYLVNNPELAKWTPIHKHYYIDAPLEVSGMRYSFGPAGLARMKGKVVWHSDELALPHLYRSAGYYEFLRPLGFHHMIGLVLGEQGKTLGYCPIWRGADMRPFTRDDMRFATLAAPHIAHGLKVADLMVSAVGANESQFVRTPNAKAGVVICDARGRVVAADPEATAIFFQMGMFDGLDPEAIDNGGFCAAFAYIGRLIGGIFGRFICKSQPPMTAIFSHRTGAVIKLRGLKTYGTDKREFFTVLVERGELAQHRRARLTARFGLNPTELRILDSLGEEQPLRHVTTRLEIARGTLKSYGRRLADKLGVPGFGGLRRFVHDQWTL
jgi:DNA-binding CsgD family transcriptional regulator